MVGLLDMLSPQDRESTFALGLLNFANGVNRANRPGASLFDGLNAGISQGGAAFLQAPQMLQQQQLEKMKLDLLKSQMEQQKSAQTARSALFGGTDPSSGINWSTGRQGMDDQQKVGMLAQAYPEEYGKGVVASLFQKPQATPASILEYEYARKNGFKGTFEDFKTMARDGGQETFGNNPIWGTDEKGNPVLMQPSNRGGVKMVQLPPGVQPQRGQTSKVDLGDKYGILDANGSLIGYFPKGTAPKTEFDEKGNRIINIPGQSGGQTQEGAAGSQPAVTSLPPSPIASRAAENNIREMETKTGLVLQDIDRALEKSGTFTTGVGSMLSGIPGTSAHDLQNLINTIKSNVGFDQLAAMRAASPTGGALGQVSEKENVLLQSVLGALEQSQSTDQFKKNLTRLKEVLAGRQERLRQAFEQDFGGQGRAPQEYDYVPGKGLVPRGQ